MGNNLDRELGTSHIDFYDGHWHMVTITTRPQTPKGTEKGFRLYVDGVFAGEMGAITVQVKDDNKPVDLQVGVQYVHRWLYTPITKVLN